MFFDSCFPSHVSLFSMLFYPLQFMVFSDLLLDKKKPLTEKDYDSVFRECTVNHVENKRYFLSLFIHIYMLINRKFEFFER